MPDYGAMSRGDLVKELVRLRQQEQVIRDEYNRMLDKALAPLESEMACVRAFLFLVPLPA